MGILRFGPEAQEVQLGDADDIGAVETAKKDITKYILPIVLIACLFLGMIVVSMASYDWYVAEALGLLGEEYDLSINNVSGRSHFAYEGSFEDYSYHSVARNLLYILIAVILMSCLFMYLVGRMEDGLEKGGSKLSFLLPSIVGTAILLLLVGGLLYFYVGFEDALSDDRGEEIDWATAGYGWPIWGATAAGLLMLPAIALSDLCAWRAIHITHRVGEGR